MEIKTNKLLNGEIVTVKYLGRSAEPLKKAIDNMTTMEFHGLECYVYQYGWNLEGNHLDAEVQATKDAIEEYNN